MNKNSFIDQFSENIKFHYTSFDRVIIRGYILKFFSVACVVLFLKAMGFSKKTNGVMRIFTDQLNSNISKQAKKYGAYIHWWPSMGGGVNGAKLKFVGEQYAKQFNGQGDHLFCIITDKENVRTVASREFSTKKGRKHQTLYKCNKPVKQYYIYFHDSVLGAPCYLKSSSYLPFPCEFYFNGHNYIKLQLDKKGISYKMKENAITDVDLSTIYEGEADPFDQPVLDHQDHKIAPPDLRNVRQQALCEELLKPKYTVNGFKTAELQRTLSDLFENSAQIRYEMKKLVVRGAINKKKNKSFYRVIETGWKWLWASITSKYYFRPPVISATFKTDPSRLPTQQHILEERLSQINQGLSQITQGLAVNM